MSEQHLSLQRPKAAPPMLGLGWSGLGDNRLLSALPSGDLQLLTGHLDKARFEQGHVLHEPGQPITRAYFVESGLVSSLAVLPDGVAIHAGFIGREGAIGLMAGLGSPIAFTRAVVQFSTTALHISIPRLAEVAARSQPIRNMIVRYNESLLEQAQKIAVCNSVHPVSERLCRWLLQARERSGSSRLPITQYGLAGALGVQRTTVTMIGRRLQAEGVIKVRRGQLQIQDAEALERRACGCWRNDTPEAQAM